MVSHTHWDREWYLPFHRFRVNLIEVVSRVLDVLETDESFNHFLLDGQSILLEDYLAIRPEDECRIRKLVGDGALSVGPWYILPDEFLVSAEATVRNLYLGSKVAAMVGEAQKVGYMPDSFGHVAQLPQILQAADIDSFIYTRGNGAEIDELGHEFRWVAPDGSEVLAVNQCGGYCNAGALGFARDSEMDTPRIMNPELAVEQVRALFGKMAELSNGDVYLVNNGCDHLPPQRGMGAILDKMRAAFPKTEFRHTSLAEYVEAVERGGFATKRYKGEMAQGRLQFILPGVWSSRTYLKQHNDEAQQLLTAYAEPVSAWLHFSGLKPYPGGELEAAWKLLLQNHPHDSICGCSVDEVHREMLPRFAGVAQTCDQVLRRGLRMLVPECGRSDERDDEVVITVVNPLARVRTAVVERVLVLLRTFDVERLQILDDTGSAVPFVVVESQLVERYWGTDYRSELFGARQREVLAASLDALGYPALDDSESDATQDRFLTVQFLARDLPALGHANFLVRTGGDTDSVPPALADSLKVRGNRLENEYCAVTVHPDGTFDLLDKIAGVEYCGLNRLEDSGDVGDEYDYAPCPGAVVVTSEGVEGEVAVVEATPFRGVIRVQLNLQLPAAIEQDRTSRVSTNVSCPVSVQVGLWYGSATVDIETRFENRACDHRLRCEFPTPIKTRVIWSDGHFYVNERSVETQDGTGFVQPPVDTRPQQDFSLVQDGTHGFALLNRGLHEVAPILRPEGTGLSLTLLRAVGWLSRNDFAARHFAHAGPMVATPDAQCRGAHVFRYAVVPFCGDFVDADIKGASQGYRTPVCSLQGVEDGLMPGGVGLVDNKSSRCCVSCVKKHDLRDTLVIRLYNLTSHSTVEMVRFSRGVAGAWRVNLLEERQGELAAGPSEVSLTIGSHKIVTIEVAFE